MRLNLKMVVPVLIGGALTASTFGAIAAGATSPADSPIRVAGTEGEGRARLVNPISVAAEQLGLESSDVRTALRDGTTLAELAAANGSSGDALVAAIVGAYQEASGAAAEADKVARIEQLVNEGGRGVAGSGFRAGLRGSLELLSSTLGMTSEELRAELAGGATIAEVAAAQSVSVDALVDAIVAALLERKPDLTDEQIATISDRLQQRIESGESPRTGHGGPRGECEAPADAGDVGELSGVAF